MTGSDIVAIVGAAAWIPQIVQWIYKAIRKPTLEILSARAIRLAYTSFGPLLTLPLSISSQNRDVIVTQMNVLVRHQSQEERLLEWNWVTEPLMNIPIPTGENVAFNKTQSVLAIKAINETLTEKIITFADVRFASAAQEQFSFACTSCRRGT